VVVLKPFAICVTAWGLAYAIPAYVYALAETPSAGERIYVKCIRTGLELHVVGGDSEIPNFEAAASCSLALWVASSECADRSTGLVECKPITDHDQQC